MKALRVARFCVVAFAASMCGCPIYSSSASDGPAPPPTRDGASSPTPATPTATNELDERLTTADQPFYGGDMLLRSFESPLGDLVADALLARYRDQGAQMVILNGGSMRGNDLDGDASDLPSAYEPSDDSDLRRPFDWTSAPPYDVVMGDVVTVYPYADRAVVRTVTAKTLFAMLENGVSVDDGRDGRFPQVAGFRFVFDPNLDLGHRVIGIVLPDGEEIAADDTEYTIVVNDYMNAGGDGYTMLSGGADRGVIGDRIQDTLAWYLRQQTSITPNTTVRITIAN